MNMCEKAVLASNIFERCNTDLKRRYFIENINAINWAMSRIPGYCGSFGTGYPFYVLDSNLEGKIPIIEEQIRYNNSLLRESIAISEWLCDNCLKENSQNMPDLKQICKPCPQVKDEIKPRRVINRLPDIDMWMICEDDKISLASKQLAYVFDDLGMCTSDVDPVKSIHDVYEIATSLDKGIMPSKKLPLDVHIIEYSKVEELLNKIVPTFIKTTSNSIAPYLAIHPLSLRKKWQYDDVAYNFAFDYLFSLTPFSWEDDLNNKLMKSRFELRSLFSENDLIEIFDLVASDSVKRRFETKTVKKCYGRRLKLWEEK